MLLSYSAQSQVMEGAAIVTVTGEIDIYAAPAFKRDLLEAMTATSEGMIVDLSALEFIDSSGLGVLIGLLRRLNGQKRPLALIITNARIIKVFVITGLDKIFEIVEDRREALAVIGARTVRGRVSSRGGGDPVRRRRPWHADPSAVGERLQAIGTDRKHQHAR